MMAEEEIGLLGLAILVIGLIAVAVILIVRGNNFIKAHHCHETGRDRYAGTSCSYIGEVLVCTNMSENEYICDGNETRWF